MNRIGRYLVEGELGQGGMGVVYLCLDEMLGRRVAVKRLRESRDPVARARLLREARAAAALQHPNVCQVYEVGEDGGELFVAMELLQGEALDVRLQRGPVEAPESLRATIELLRALGALHESGLVHRDVKPSNIFLTAHGTKLLDFGLSRSHAVVPDDTVARDLTQTGMIVGTPRYMAPEQWDSAAVGPAADIFAAGAILFEMLSGEPAFPGRTLLEVHDAIVRHEPPTLAGGLAVAAIDRIVQRALQRLPRHRFSGAGEMADALQTCLSVAGSTELARVQRLSRLLVLPLRIPRPDPEIDFLCFSLPDAVAGALASLDSVVVRSGTGRGEIDPQQVFRESEVDLILSGSVVRVGEQIRVTAQLLGAPDATVRGAATAQGSRNDLFALQDGLVEQIVELLGQLHNGRAGSPPQVDQPRNAAAYEHYLRANAIAFSWVREETLSRIRDHYQACLQEDPAFAPAWARLGRVHRVRAKYGYGIEAEESPLAEAAFRRALELNPDLSVAHDYYTYFEVEEGRSRDAMVRLIERALTRPSDPRLFAGLVVACRFCGLLDASLEADRRARRLDPAIRTSVQYTHLARGDINQAIAMEVDDPPFCRLIGPALLGHPEDSLRQVKSFLETRGIEGLEAIVLGVVVAALEGDHPGLSRLLREPTFLSFKDPEGRMNLCRFVARAGLDDELFAHLRRVLNGGFLCFQNLADEPWFVHLRDEPRLRAMLREAEQRRDEAQKAFLAAGGRTLLGIAS